MARKKKSRLRRWMRYAFLAVTALVLSVSLFVLLTWPDVAALAESNPETTAFIERARSRGADVEW